MDQSQTKKHFDYRWQQEPVTGEEIEERARNRIERNGWALDEFKDWVEGKKVLDVGCGMGWWTHYINNLHDDEKTQAIGIDISEKAIEKGQELGIENIKVGNMGDLDFPDEEFDYIAVENTLHQTPSPKEFFQHIVTKLKPSGTITMYVYKEKALLRETADTILREKTVEMSREECIEFSEKVTELGRELYEVDEQITVPDVPLLDIEAGTYSVHEFVYRYLLRCYYDWDGKGWDYSVISNFNWYNPEYTYRFSESELRTMFEDAGMNINHFNEQMSGHSVRAVKED